MGIKNFDIVFRKKYNFERGFFPYFGEDQIKRDIAAVL